MWSWVRHCLKSSFVFAPINLATIPQILLCMNSWNSFPMTLEKSCFQTGLADHLGPGPCLATVSSLQRWNNSCAKSKKQYENFCFFCFFNKLSCIVFLNIYLFFCLKSLSPMNHSTETFWIILILFEWRSIYLKVTWEFYL